MGGLLSPRRARLCLLCCAMPTVLCYAGEPAAARWAGKQPVTCVRQSYWCARAVVPKGAGLLFRPIATACVRCTPNTGEPS